MMTLKKTAAMVLALVLCLTAGISLAEGMKPDDPDIDRLAGAAFNATVGAYNEDTKTFQVTIYVEDIFDKDAAEKLTAGSIFLAGGWRYVAQTVEPQTDGTILIKCEDGEEMYFTPVGDDGMSLRSVFNDRRYMSVIAVVNLPAAANIRLEDASDPDSTEPKVVTGLEEILKVKAEKEETSNGLDYYATKVTLNSDFEIELIHQDYDVAQ